MLLECSRAKECWINCTHITGQCEWINVGRYNWVGNWTWWNGTNANSISQICYLTWSVDTDWTGQWVGWWAIVKTSHYARWSCVILKASRWCCEIYWNFTLFYICINFFFQNASRLQMHELLSLAKYLSVKYEIDSVRKFPRIKQKMETNSILPRIAESQLICVALMNQCLPKVKVDVAATVIDMGPVPSKSTTTCWPEFSPHIFGTLVAPPVIWITSVEQTPSPFGPAIDRSENSTRSWHTVSLHGFTVIEQLQESRQIFQSMKKKSWKIKYLFTYVPPLQRPG